MKTVHSYDSNQRRYLLNKGVIHMYQDEEEDKTIYKVVLNHEEQYSIWPGRTPLNGGRT